MKNYVKPEVEVLNFQAENIMLNTFNLTSIPNVEGGWGER